MLRHFFSFYNFVEKDFGADKKGVIPQNRSGDTFYTPGFRLKRRSLEGCKVEKGEIFGFKHVYCGCREWWLSRKQGDWCCLSFS